MKANIDLYLNQTIDLTLFGEEVRVKQPSVGLVKKIIQIAGQVTGESLDDIIDLAVEALNNNVSGRHFSHDRIETLPMSALTAIIQAISGQAAEAEANPN